MVGRWRAPYAQFILTALGWTHGVTAEAMALPVGTFPSCAPPPQPGPGQVDGPACTNDQQHTVGLLPAPVSQIADLDHISRTTQLPGLWGEYAYGGERTLTDIA